jgi:predicted transposase YdaD
VWVYLDAIDQQRERSLEIGIVKLVLERENRAVKRGKDLIYQARQELTDDRDVEKEVGLIKTV